MAAQVQFRMVEDGRLQPVIAERVALDGVAAAHRRLENGEVVGKVIVALN